MITAEATHQHLAEGFPVGMRLHSAPVVRLADAKPVQLGHVAEADGAGASTRSPMPTAGGSARRVASSGRSSRGSRRRVRSPTP